jgi:HTH-type transcriptional regulator/antitoxin HigA
MSFHPDWVSPPGDTIAAILDEQKMSTQEFIDQTGFTKNYAEGLLAGTAGITPAVAKRLSEVLGSTSKFWLRRDRRYWDGKAGLEV